MDNGNYNIEPIIRRIQETAFTEGYEAGKKEAVKRGKWQGANEMPYDDIMVCSECKHEAYWDTDYGQQLFDYCPNCGADMRGEDNE